MTGMVWFGNQDLMTWVPAPLTGAIVSPVRWQDTQTTLNGGVFSSRSAVQHQSMSLSWSANRLGELDRVIRVLNRNKMIQYVDPVTSQYNAMPSYWAEYMDGAPELFPGLVPTRVTTGASNGYSPDAMRYAVSGTVTSRFRLYVPSGFSLYFGAHGTRSGTAEIAIGGTNVPLQATSSRVRYSIVKSGGTSYPLSVSGTGQLTLNGLTAVIAKNPPEPGDFISGYGNSGFLTNGEPQINEYSAVIPNAQIALTAELVEAGAWQ